MDDSSLNLTSSTVTSPVERTRRGVEIANRAVEGYIIPFPGYPGVEFNAKFDWEYSPEGLGATYQLYLQNLRVVGELLNEYEHTDGLQYLDRASEIVDSWLDYIDSGRSVEMTWYDHAVATRSRILAAYMYACRKAGESCSWSRLQAQLVKHANLLMDDSIHRVNNHGLMVDHALISAGLVLGDDSYVFNGIGRARSIFWQSFSPRGVHQENSPEYHRMVSRMFRELEEYLSRNGLGLGEDVLSMFEPIDRYLATLAKPDRRVPAIGDSSAGIVADDVLWGSFNDESSGVTVIKSRLNQLYLAFIAGYSLLVHKHSDDLSVILSSGRSEFFVEAGKYNYGTNKFRRYVVSGRAHSAFSLARGYDKSRDNKVTRLIATDHFLDAIDYTVVSGYNAGYDGAILRRTIYYIEKENLIYIRDQGKSNHESEVWRQRFNLHQAVDVEQVGTSAMQLTNSDEMLYVEFLGGGSVSVVEPEMDSKWVRAVNSPSAGKVVATRQLLCEHAGLARFDAGILIAVGEPTEVQIEESSFGTRLSVRGQEYLLPRFELEPSEMFAPWS